jgi:mannan endo-1,4-beta-mannosidase
MDRKGILKASLVLLHLLLITPQLSAQSMVDKKATAETKALYSNLTKISKQGILFGHQDTDAYGVHWKADGKRSDVKDITGAFPAVHGWDLGKIGGPLNIDSVDFQKMLEWIRATYQRGGINTISWHLDNPLTGESSWSKGDAVKESLPGGKAHQKYLEHLNYVADFLNKCTSGTTMIPIIFRPFHEHNGDWFWWGKGVCAEDEYIALWKFTIQYLRDEKKLHHLIYAFSPDRSRIDINNFRSGYLYGYPGDEFVDILGYDDYQDLRNQENVKQRSNDLIYGLREISAIAKEKNKVAALTETGQEKIPDAKFFTGFLLPALKADPAIQISYLLLWRNARPDHHYAPYKGHPAEADFVNFYKAPETLFEEDVRNIYSSKKLAIKK